MYGTQSSLPHSQEPVACSYPEPGKYSPLPLYLKPILVLYSHLSLGLPSVLFPSGFLTKTFYVPVLSPCMPHASPISFFLIRSPEMWRSSSLCRLLQSPVSSSPLGTIIFPRTLLSNTTRDCTGRQRDNQQTYCSLLRRRIDVGLEFPLGCHVLRALVRQHEIHPLEQRSEILPGDPRHLAVQLPESSIPVTLIFAPPDVHARIAVLSVIGRDLPLRNGILGFGRRLSDHLNQKYSQYQAIVSSRTDCHTASCHLARVPHIVRGDVTSTATRSSATTLGY